MKLHEDNLLLNAPTFSSFLHRFPLACIRAMHGLTFSQWERLGYCHSDWPVSRMLWMGTMKNPSPQCWPKNACLHVINFSLCTEWEAAGITHSLFCFYYSHVLKRVEKKHSRRIQNGKTFSAVHTLKCPMTNAEIWIAVEMEQTTWKRGWYVLCKSWPGCSLCGQMSAAAYIKTYMMEDKTWENLLQCIDVGLEHRTRLIPR